MEFHALRFSPVMLNNFALVRLGPTGPKQWAEQMMDLQSSETKQPFPPGKKNDYLKCLLQEQETGKCRFLGQDNFVCVTIFSL